MKACGVLISAFADRKKQFFNNLEEVKKVIHADVDTGRPVCANAEKHGF
jgi:hypothetical protein